MLWGYTVGILEVDVEDILWVKIMWVDEEENIPLFLPVCYIAPDHLVDMQMNCHNCC